MALAKYMESCKVSDSINIKHTTIASLLST